MNTIKKLVLISSILFISACGTVPQPPDEELCALIWTGQLETSFAYCKTVVSDVETRKVPLSEVVQSGWFATTPKAHGNVLKYIEELKAWANNQAK